MLKDVFKEAIEDSKSNPIFKKVFSVALNKALLKLSKDDIYLTIIPSKELFFKLKNTGLKFLVTDNKRVDWVLSPEGLLIADLRKVISGYLGLATLMIKSVEEDSPLVSFRLTNDLTEEVIVELSPKDIETISFGDSRGVIDLSLVVSALVESVRKGIEEGIEDGIKDVTGTSPNAIETKTKTEEVINKIVKQIQSRPTLNDITNICIQEFVNSGYIFRLTLTSTFCNEVYLDSTVLELHKDTCKGCGFSEDSVGSPSIWASVDIDGKALDLNIPYTDVVLSSFKLKDSNVGGLHSVVSYVVRKYMETLNKPEVEEVIVSTEKPVNTHSPIVEVTGKDTAKIVSLVNYRKKGYVNSN